MKTVPWEDVFEEKRSDSFSGYVFVTRSENYPLCKTMVDHDHDRIKRVGEGKAGDEVDRKLLERAGGQGRDWREGWYGRVSEHFVGLTNGATGNKAAYKAGHTRPPVIVLEELERAKNAAMTASGGFMNGADEVRAGVQGNVETALVVKVGSVKEPIIKDGAGEWGKTGGKRANEI